MTTDPNDLIQSDEEEELPTKMDTKQGQKQAYGNQPSLPSTIKVRKSSDSQEVTSSVPGLSSLMDMSMTEISEENQISMVKGCIKRHVFSIWKIMKHTNIRGTQNWWLGMQRIVVKSHTDLRNNAIKNMQMKFKGKDLK